ncbi:unnamed protein product [Arctia plantaginis]|uniref:Uncharacterized protein n=1 Tax=Arctia plantaginis TaxID=874455 RepID=A0A8S0Z486_ARCPL|nr:unnamed protein product [Arctia plantaginis]
MTSELNGCIVKTSDVTPRELNTSKVNESLVQRTKRQTANERAIWGYKTPSTKRIEIGAEEVSSRPLEIL